MPTWKIIVNHDALLHVTYSLVQQTFRYVEVFEAVGSERDRVYENFLKDALVIADRGYVNEELEQRLDAAGVKYVIRGKSNTQRTILEAYAENGQKIPELKGRRVSDVPSHMNADLKVSTMKGNTLRVPPPLQPKFQGGV